MKKTYDLTLPQPKTGKRFSIAKTVDAEKLFRLNPLWIIESFAIENNIFQVDIKNYATDEQSQLTGNYTVDRDDVVSLIFDSGEYGILSIKSDGDTFKADVTYANPAFEEESEEERHTILWIKAIQEYLRLYLKKSINTIFFRYIMNRIVLQMTPSQRKISLMLIRITIVEIAVILVIVVGYVFFVLKPSGAP